MRILLAIGLLCFACPAAAANDIEVEVTSKALLGRTKPAVLLIANKEVVSAKATLTSDQGHKVTLTSGRIPAGSQRSLQFDAPVGTSHWSGELEVRLVDGTAGEMPLSFDVEVGRGLTITVPEDRLNLKESKLQLQLSGPADQCEYRVDFDGKPERHGFERFDGEPAGTWLTVSWPAHGPDDVVLRIQLQCQDRSQFFSGVELFPWKLAIPHEDVVFETGKWEVLPGESAKLKVAQERIQEAVRRYGKIVPIKLYVMGHTDTVGDAGSNVVLSKNRARAIAAWFRKSGLKVPVFAAGFGESQLAVPTPDDTDEQKNRRADYVLSNQPPGQAAWEGL
jgi:outer membrane protein OmpA-like peptidoglycan-associated protein